MHMKEYSLILNDYHFTPLLEALRLHQVAVTNAPSTEQERRLIADLVRRAELLQTCAEAGANLRDAQEAYSEYCAEGDAPTVSPVKVRTRPI